VKVLVEKGEKILKGDHLMITESMKMETTVQAPFDGVITEIYAKNGEGISTGDLLAEIQK
jgi:pyruvate carboxylase